MSKSQAKPSAICLVVLELGVCVAIYLACICLRRLQRRHRWFRPETKQNLPNALDFFPEIPCAALPAPERLDCGVCLSPFKRDETLRFVPLCGHVFHRECVDPWLALHATCPYGRACLAPFTRQPHRSAGSVVIVLTVGDYPSGVSGVAAPEDSGCSDGQRVVIAGERCPPMGRRGGSDQATTIMSESASQATN